MELYIYVENFETTRGTSFSAVFNVDYSSTSSPEASGLIGATGGTGTGSTNTVGTFSDSATGATDVPGRFQPTLRGRKITTLPSLDPVVI